MRNKLSVTTLAGAWLLASQAGVASATGDNYAGLQYAVGDYSEEGISENFKPSALVARLGKQFTPNFSVEGRLGLGLQDDTQFVSELGVSGLDANLEIDTLIGVYAAGHLNLTESLSIYGLLGASRIEGEASVPAFPAATNSDSDSGFSYGAGLDIGISNDMALNIEYMQYLNESNLDISAIALGLTFSF